MRRVISEGFSEGGRDARSWWGAGVAVALLGMLPLAWSQSAPTPPSLNASGIEWRDLAVLWGASGTSFTLSMEIDERDPSTIPEFFEIAIAWIERPSQSRLFTVQAAEMNPRVTRPGYRLYSVNITRPGAGHLAIAARSCQRPETVGGEHRCSIWVDGTDPQYGRVAGQNRGFMVYGFLTPPIPGGVE